MKNIDFIFFNGVSDNDHVNFNHQEVAAKLLILNVLQIVLLKITLFCFDI